MHDHDVRTWSITLLCGVVFGIALQMGRVHEFLFVRQQAQLTAFLMTKMFISAASTSVLIIYMMSQFGTSSMCTYVTNARENWTSKRSRTTPAIVMGCAITGMGIAVAGSCPGTVFVQLGAGSSTAWIVFAGTLIGAASFALFEMTTPSVMSQYVNRTLVRFEEAPSAHVAEKPPTSTANGAGVISILVGTITVLALLEILSPWRTELKKLGPFGTHSVSFPPIVSGILIGSLQLPLMSLAHSQLGTSTSYATIVAHLAWWMKGSNTMNQARTRYGQLFLVLGMVIGSFISSHMVRASFQSDSLVSTSSALFGGILLGFGTRLASGCTSGHGISGLGLLAKPSIIGTVTMFASAIITGLLFL